ncbi:hypothetical protein G7Y89_g6688 [Cudoniella acicularis]|uniref:RRM domain-containing protein n=1 Tax=Cudoniella acicularis TaxID=354080 RepID=A0A8H4W274_9HELO|nr:hypothetical protein G7Y89_g6688 [Cudoniella acicularis]
MRNVTSSGRLLDNMTSSVGTGSSGTFFDALDAGSPQTHIVSPYRMIHLPRPEVHTQDRARFGRGTTTVTPKQTQNDPAIPRTAVRSAAFNVSDTEILAARVHNERLRRLRATIHSDSHGRRASDGGTASTGLIRRGYLYSRIRALTSPLNTQVEAPPANTRIHQGAWELARVSPATPPALNMGRQISQIEPSSRSSLKPNAGVFPTPQTSSQITISTRTVVPRQAPARFRPSRMWLDVRGLTHPSYPPLLQANAENSNYRGERGTRHIHGLADHHNCSLFITNIPPSANYADLFDLIRAGNIFSLHIIPPEGQFDTAAAFLVFMRPEDARVMHDSETWLWGHHLRIRYNREGSLPTYQQQTRVLVVEGPRQIMNIDWWRIYFDSFCFYEWERVIQRPRLTPGRSILEFRFVRVEGQSRMCLGAIRKDPALNALDVKVGYGVDPCSQ